MVVSGHLKKIAIWKFILDAVHFQKKKVISHKKNEEFLCNFPPFFCKVLMQLGKARGEAEKK